VSSRIGNHARLGAACGLRQAADNDWDYGNGTRVGMGVAVGSGCLRGGLRVGGFVVWKVFSSSLAVEMG
jgi:hypothetical protein